MFIRLNYKDYNKKIVQDNTKLQLDVVNFF
jgi:hypothetical protein